MEPDQAVIDDCDYYLLIVAGRYGSIGPNGVNYTEMEYDYALSVGKPTIAFVHRDPGKIAAEKTETTDEGREKLHAFRGRVEERLCKQWTTPQELGSVVSRSLIQLIKSTPAVGWVRANELADREATLELLTLRRRVEALESELARARTSAPRGTEELSQGEELHHLRFRFRVADPDSDSFSFGLRSSAHIMTSSVEATWNEIFSTVAPLMIDEAVESAVKTALDAMVQEKAIASLRERDELQGKSLGGFALDNDDFQTVKVQLRALGLIARSEKARSVRDTDTYWTLTPYGDEVMTRLRAIRRNRDGGVSSAASTPDDEDEDGV